MGHSQKEMHLSKNRMFEILWKEVTVRLDLLHLINRAHHEARGKFLEEDDLDLGENETESNEERSNIGYIIKKLIDYIQNKVKVFRNGLEYS